MKTIRLHVRHPWVKKHLEACEHKNKQGVVISFVLDEMRKNLKYTVTVTKGDYFDLRMTDAEATLFLIKWGTKYTRIDL